MLYDLNNLKDFYANINELDGLNNYRLGKGLEIIQKADKGFSDRVKGLIYFPVRTNYVLFTHTVYHIDYDSAVKIVEDIVRQITVKIDLRTK